MFLLASPFHLDSQASHPPRAQSFPQPLSPTPWQPPPCIICGFAACPVSGQERGGHPCLLSLSHLSHLRGHQIVNSVSFTSSNVSAFLCLTDTTLVPILIISHPNDYLSPHSSLCPSFLSVFHTGLDSWLS